MLRQTARRRVSILTRFVSGEYQSRELLVYASGCDTSDCQSAWEPASRSCSYSENPLFTHAWEMITGNLEQALGGPLT